MFTIRDWFATIWLSVTDYFSAISSDDDEEFFELPSENCQKLSNDSDKNGVSLSQHESHSKTKSTGIRLFALSSLIVST